MCKSGQHLSGGGERLQYVEGLFPGVYPERAGALLSRWPALSRFRLYDVLGQDACFQEQLYGRFFDRAQGRYHDLGMALPRKACRLPGSAETRRRGPE